LGVGVINGSVVNFGTLQSGDDPGTLTVNGNYKQGTTGTLAIEVGPSSYSQLVVNGSATLAGTLSFVSFDGGMIKLGQSYDILTATGGITGNFSTIESGSQFITLTGVTANGEFELTALHTPGSFADLAETRNQHAVAIALDEITMGAPVGAAAELANILANSSPATVQASFDQLSGEAYATVNGILAEDSKFVRNAALDRMRAAFGGAGAPVIPVVGYAPPGEVIAPGLINPALPEFIGPPQGLKDAPATIDGLAFWAQGFGAWGSEGTNGNAAGASRRIGGFFAGADWPAFDGWRLGYLAGSSETTFKVSDRASSGTSENADFGIFAGTQWGGLGLRIGSAYIWHDITMDRGIAFSGFGEDLTGRYGAGTAQAFGEFGYAMAAGPVAMEPFGNIAYVNLHSEGFTESGGVAALTALDSNTDTVFTTLGLRASAPFAFNGNFGLFRFSAGWRHAFGDVTPLSAFSIAGSDPFTVAGVPVLRDAAVIETGIDVNIRPNVAFGISYGGQLGSGANDESVKGNLTFRF
jgi:fibronectin-binding autotransporter adhesin